MSKTHVHLVGSVELGSAHDVFALAAKVLGDRVKRFPDGETGPNRRWISMQQPVAATNPQLMPSTTSSQVPGFAYHHFEVRPEVKPKDVRFGPLGYVGPARESYAEFLRMRDAGTVPATAKFLVTFPTPAAFLWCYITPKQRPLLEAAYLARLEDEVKEILRSIPHEDLAIQWDTVHEILMIEGARDSQLTPDEHQQRLVRVADMVPPTVELGFHFCYGYASRKHTVEPRDTGLIVEIANHLAATTARPLDFIHLPVPRDRDDEAFFRPLRDLKLSPSTEIYLGLIHWTDKFEGAKRRIAAARAHLDHFGVATECGMRGRPPETMEPLMQLHREVAEALDT